MQSAVPALDGLHGAMLLHFSTCVTRRSHTRRADAHDRNMHRLESKLASLAAAAAAASLPLPPAVVLVILALLVNLCSCSAALPDWVAAGCAKAGLLGLPAPSALLLDPDTGDVTRLVDVKGAAPLEGAAAAAIGEAGTGALAGDASACKQMRLSVSGMVQVFTNQCIQVFSRSTSLTIWDIQILNMGYQIP